ncbi:hypothetical protein Y032_0036g3254 [Ancylostoma ceylanicum]|uniref:Uncharacterized protein n=1 Tax=Ancylostoma ceylanicum TaxID=53326 RepID=A0A016UL51_9BILA|nr:hypothetical protein Y032_0036g3254 [Ancylostoma ceylanicum]
MQHIKQCNWWLILPTVLADKKEEKGSSQDHSGYSKAHDNVIVSLLILLPSNRSSNKLQSIHQFFPTVNLWS